MFKIPEYLKILKEVHAKFIVRPLEIPKKDVLFPPRPLILISALFLHVQQKSLYLFLEAPERSTTEECVTRWALFDCVEEAESVVDSVVATKIVSVLLVALAVIDVQGFAVGVSDQLRKGSVGNLFFCFADVLKRAIKNISEKFIN